MRYWLIIGLLLFPAVLSADTLKERIDARSEAVLADDTKDDTQKKESIAVIVDEEVAAEVSGFAEKIKPIEIPVLELDIIQLVKLDLETLRVVIASMTPLELNQLQTVILSPETIKLALAKISAQDIPKLAILIYDFGYQARLLNKTFLPMIENEKLKELFRLIPSKQYPVVKFPFLDTILGDPDIYVISITKWVDVIKMKEEIKNRKIKLALIGGYYQDFLVSTQIRVLDSKTYEIVYQAFKEVRPDVPVAFGVYLHPSLQGWLNGFTIQPDCWVVYNVGGYNANWEKVKKRWFANVPVIATVPHGDKNPSGVYGDEEYKTFIERLKSLDYVGSIYWREKK